MPNVYEPVVQFSGYRLVDRYQKFSDLADGVPVRELLKPRPGGRGLVRTFSGGQTRQTVTFVTDEQLGLACEATRMGKIARNLTNYACRRYYYEYHKSYGSSETNSQLVSVTAARLSADRKKVSLALDKLVPGYVCECIPGDLRAKNGTKKPANRTK